MGALLAQAVDVAVSYQARGLSLTLRQLYYQMVAHHDLENSQKSYKRLGSLLARERLAGNFEPTLIIDRGRSAPASEQLEIWLSVVAGLERAARDFSLVPYRSVRTDRWYGQPKYVSVWVEKDALKGVFEEPCDKLGVGLFACKGYPSHSALWEWLAGLGEASNNTKRVVSDDSNDFFTAPIEEAVILYFGDHDPDGWEIPRAAERGMNQLALQYAEQYELDLPPIRFKRVALNRAQIEAYKPAPFPAKMSSSRYAKYVREHGTQSAWELDALDPEVLQDLIYAGVNQLFDADIYDVWSQRVRSARSAMIDRMDVSWLREVLL